VLTSEQDPSVAVNEGFAKFTFEVVDIRAGNDFAIMLVARSLG
jgi:hypothetical protein